MESEALKTADRPTGHEQLRDDGPGALSEIDRAIARIESGVKALKEGLGNVLTSERPELAGDASIPAPPNRVRAQGAVLHGIADALDRLIGRVDL
jgi:hypothetical protein